MKRSILNRAFEHPTDGWYQIEAFGEHPNAEANVVQVIDGTASASIVNRFNTAADAGALRHGHEMLIDHEHFSDQPDQETRAYGWLQELQSRADGIYGRIRWTSTGQAAVDGGDYRFFSTEYLPKDFQAIPKEKVNAAEAILRVRPMRLAGLTLTNMNNNRGQKPITNREDPAKPFAGASAQASVQNQNTPKINRMKSIATKLGLTAEASEDAILAEVSKLQNRLTELQPAAEEVTALRNRVRALDESSVDALLSAHGITDSKVLNRMKPILTGMAVADRQAFLDECLPKPAAATAQTAATSQTAQANQASSNQVKLHNRDTRPPKDAGQDAESKSRSKATAIMNRARAIQKETPNLSTATAVIMAQKEMEESNPS